MSYISVSTTDNQKRWAAYQLELGALGLCLKKNESLFINHPEIHVYTDNSVVVNVHKYVPINNREGRLLAYIANFNIHVHYVPGVKNTLADALSRLPEDMTTEQKKSFKTFELDERDDFLLALTENHTVYSAENYSAEKTNGEDKWTTYAFHITSSRRSPSQHHKDSNKQYSTGPTVTSGTSWPTCVQKFIRIG